MFSYCNNNPSNAIDSTGSFPLAAVIGGAIGGALVSLTSYLGNCEKSGDSPTLGGGLLAVAAGGASGALGGLTVACSSGIQIALCVFGAGTIAGAYTEYTSDSFLTGFISGSLGTWFGSLFDIKMFSGFDLGAASYYFSVFTGFCAELGVAAAQEIFKEEPAPNSNASHAPAVTIGGGGTGGCRSVGSQALCTAMLY